MKEYRAITAGELQVGNSFSFEDKSDATVFTALEVFDSSTSIEQKYVRIVLSHDTTFVMPCGSALYLVGFLGQGEG